MPKFVRSIRPYQNNLTNISKEQDTFYNLGVKTRVNNTLTMLNQLPVPIPIKQPQEDNTPKYHTGAKYGASKYIGTLQSGKMHKLIHNS